MNISEVWGKKWDFFGCSGDLRGNKFVPSPFKLRKEMAKFALSFITNLKNTINLYLSMKKTLLLFAACLAFLTTSAQDGIYGDYTEPDDTTKADPAQWNATPDGLQTAWGSRDVRYVLRNRPDVGLCRDTTVYAWRGERVAMQAVLYSKTQTGNISLKLTGKNKALLRNSAARFVNYVLTDDFRGCGNNPNYNTSRKHLVADVIDNETSKVLPAMMARPVWVSVEVPRDIRPGTYQLRLVVKEEGSKAQQLCLSVVVNARTLPQPKDYAFNLNFWMQPYAVSRYYKVPNWSQAHFDALRPYMQMLARSGQKVATAILFYEPWGVQSNDKFEPMIETTKRADGSWVFDYSVFDRWITFLDSCGINRQINCFSMVPWDMSFRYTDESTHSYGYLNVKTSDAAYKELWTAFLKDFAAHLKAKGWYEKTCIAMDERGLKDMLTAYDIAQAAVPGIKMALAGYYHKELADKLYDYCISYGDYFTPEEFKHRNEKGWVSTTYTACGTAAPNVCSNNEPADAAFLPVYSVANGFNGFLRWAWMNWTDDPLRDTQFKMFTAGDTYMVYPGVRSSIRYERTIEGVQQAEKIRLLREAYAANGQTAELDALNAAVDKCKTPQPDKASSSATLVNDLERLLNEAGTNKSGAAAKK